MGCTTPYYPHAFYTLLSSWQDNPPIPIQLYITTETIYKTVQLDHSMRENRLKSAQDLTLKQLYSTENITVPFI